MVLHWVYERWQHVGKHSIDHGFKAVSLLFDERKTNDLMDQRFAKSNESIEIS
jgi:hypothetical protein